MNGEIRTLCKQGRLKEAMNVLHVMDQHCIRPDSSAYAALLDECSNKKALLEGKLVHAHMNDTGFTLNILLGNKLVTMYAKCGSLEDARQLFDKMPERNVFSWNALLAGCAQSKHVSEASKLFRRMPERDVISWNVMIAGHFQIGHFDEGLKLFQKMPERDVVSWNAMIAGYAQAGHVYEALKLFQRMPECNVVSWTAMIAGYAQNGRADEALKLFQKMPQRNVVSWNTMIAGCTQNGHFNEGLGLFQKMPARSLVSWNAMVAAYAQNGRVDDALKLFQKMPEHNVVSWTAVIAGYSQSGNVDDALKLFQRMPERNAVSWNTMIAGYAQSEAIDEALKLFRLMQLEGLKGDSATFISVLSVCAKLAALRNGKEVHENVLRWGFHSHVFVGSALIDMYAKCGAIDDARKVFDKMSERDVVSWTAMIMGYAMHGYGQQALQLFEEMQHSGTNPDHVTFIGVLSACCHAGLVDDGWQYFDRMSRDYHIMPVVEHYCCMVDLLGRAGHLDEAQDFINKIPIDPDAAVWGSLLGACRTHNNIEVGQRVAERLCQLEPKNAGNYVLLSNIYAAAGRWEDAEKVRKIMKDFGIRKNPGCSWIELNKNVYSFVVQDRSHPQMHEICLELERLSGQMKEAGYVADTNLILHDVEEGTQSLPSQ